MKAPPDKVIVAMSGGVDSAVAAKLLADRGFEVVGTFMCMGTGELVRPADEPAIKQSCCSPQDADDARRVAGKLGIPFYVLNFAADLDRIIDYFAAEYARGRTPNPCAWCNQLLKFGKLLDYADQIGARYVATGHHARIVATADGPAVYRARGRQKDQSYVLFGLPREVLSRVLLPIGELADKAEVRRIARQLDLDVAEKPDSQDVCFVGDGDYTQILRRRAAEAMRPGKIVTIDGEHVGEHEGIGHFTVGQRRGLRIPAGEPMYVVHIDAESSTVTIGPRPAAAGEYLLADGANWHAGPADGEGFPATVQIRYSHQGAPARVRPLPGDRFEVRFAQPVHAITPGQIAAVYDGDRLLGGGWICNPGRPPA